MWFETKHRNLALFAAFVCVLAGAFGFGDEPDERLFRSRTSRCSRTGSACQSHQVLDNLHDEHLSILEHGSSSAGDSEAKALPERRDSAPPQLSQLVLPVRRIDPLRTGFVLRDRGRAPPSFVSLF